MKPRFEHERHPEYHTNPVYRGVKTYKGYPKLMATEFVFETEEGYALAVRRIHHRIFEKRHWARLLVHGNHHFMHYCVAGRSELIDGGRAIAYKPGRLFALTREDRLHHDHTRPASFESFCFVFDVQDHAFEGKRIEEIDSFQTVRMPRRLVDLASSQRKALERRIFRLVALARDPPPGYPLLVRAEVLAIFGLFMEWDVVRIVRVRRDAFPRHWHHRLWVMKAKRFILSHYYERLRLEDIATHTGVDASYLNKLFKAATGKSLARFLNGVRIDAAKNLMLGGRTNITAIAMEVGFTYPSYFASRFRKATGCSPREFLRQFWAGG